MEQAIERHRVGGEQEMQEIQSCIGEGAALNQSRKVRLLSQCLRRLTHPNMSLFVYIGLSTIKD